MVTTNKGEVSDEFADELGLDTDASEREIQTAIKSKVSEIKKLAK